MVELLFKPFRSMLPQDVCLNGVLIYHPLIAHSAIVMDRVLCALRMM